MLLVFSISLIRFRTNTDWFPIPLIHFKTHCEFVHRKPLSMESFKLFSTYWKLIIPTETESSSYPGMVRASFGAFFTFEKINSVVTIPSKQVYRYVHVAYTLLEASEKRNKREFPPPTNPGIFNVGNFSMFLIIFSQCNIYEWLNFSSQFLPFSQSFCKGDFIVKLTLIPVQVNQK